MMELYKSVRSDNLDKIYVYSADDHISYLANTINADSHKHLDLQMSISVSEYFNLNINGGNGEKLRLKVYK